MNPSVILLTGANGFLGRHVAATIPLSLEIRTLARERLGEMLDRVRDERVGLLHRAARLIDEARLRVAPTRPASWALPSSARFCFTLLD